MCGIDTYPKVWEGWGGGKASKQASRATPATQLQQKQMAMPLQTSLDPPPDPGEMAALARF